MSLALPMARLRPCPVDHRLQEPSSAYQRELQVHRRCFSSAPVLEPLERRVLPDHPRYLPRRSPHLQEQQVVHPSPRQGHCRHQQMPASCAVKRSLVEIWSIADAGERFFSPLQCGAFRSQIPATRASTILPQSMILFWQLSRLPQSFLPLYYTRGILARQ